jgi:hypothetical protein
MDILSADFMGGALAGLGAGGALVYWLLMRGKSLAVRGQPRPAVESGSWLNVTSLFGANQKAPMAAPVFEQARNYTDQQATDTAAYESHDRMPDGHVFPVDIDGDIRRVVVTSRHLRQFISLDRPVRARTAPDGSRTAGFTGDTVAYRDLLLVARAYGWVVDAGRRGVEWSEECRTLGRRVIRLRERNSVTLPCPMPGDDDYRPRLPG